MLSPRQLSRLASLRVVLASGSPRRRELCERLGLAVEVIPSAFPETLDKATFDSPAAYVAETARQKALEVQTREPGADLIIGSDTVVVCDDRILEKPADAAAATAMLRALAGRGHEVITAVALLRAGQPETVFTETARVVFGDLSDEVIEGYVASGEPMDKAGAYGIQGLGGSLISGIEGDFYTVMGFPMHRVCVELGRLVED